MKVETVITGVLDENCYILIKDGNCLVVDPGSDYPKIKEKIGDNKVLGVLITHSHFDHIGALRNFLTKKSIKIFKKSNIIHNEEYTIGNFKFKAICTPGHATDEVTYYFEDEKTMFVGDFIFKGSIGRWDFPGGSEKEMKESINLIKEYDKDITVYPGHGKKTTLMDEFNNNPYFN